MPKSARKRHSRKLKTKKGGKKRSRKLKYIKKRKQSGGGFPSGELTNIWCLGKYGGPNIHNNTCFLLQYKYNNKKPRYIMLDGGTPQIVSDLNMDKNATLTTHNKNHPIA